MALSKLAQQFADEIRLQDWTDAHIRRDRAGHNRMWDTKSHPNDPVLDAEQTQSVKTNVMWVTAQVLGYNDPNFDVYEFAQACGVNTMNNRGGKDGSIAAGLRTSYGRYMRPGTYELDPLTEVVTTDTSDAYHASTSCPMFLSGYQNKPILKFSREEVPDRWKPCQCITSSQS
ncbi:hypothetical protein GCM10010287_51800 [Streptomyces variabilis]|uniref:Uncharacterized protein n=1 Tax=Streptomyces variabilis TaxID=67372 RepID=A0ABQ2U6R5_9ACTN|nr:hypothetical protein [Streptomyces variabilis]GGP61854.1 hypothetical protein GCM10010265_44900 [Streptomyces griseoincarnatus]GGT70968.1 hypothetical protein GCM10010287_51800 [Streptomyces variabilis]